MDNKMETLVALCKRRGFMFQSSDIYGGLKGFWDYGPLGVELKRNVREAWYRDMITNHNELVALPGAPSSFSMVSVETSIIMHPQVWKCSGHYDLFHDFMIDCKSCKSRFRADHLQVAVAFEGDVPLACTTFMYDIETGGLSKGKTKKLMGTGKDVIIKNYSMNDYAPRMAERGQKELSKKLIPHCPECNGDLTDAREFNLMFKTIVGALATEEEGTAFLRPETAQGMFVNFKNVVDSSRVKIPFGIAQIGKSFRNEITPRNYTFRSREFEQMEMEFFCHPEESPQWYTYWRDRRFQWYQDLGIRIDNLIMREHTQDEMAHYSVGTADVEYAFPFLDEGEYGELEGVAHRGDFDLRSHSEGKLINQDGKLVVELNDDGKPKYKGSGKDLSYFNDQTRERFIPHVIEPAAGADRTTLAFLCEAFTEDEQPDDKGKMQTRTLMKLHPRLAPVKAAVFPLIKKEGMPEQAAEIYMSLKKAGIVAQYDQQGAIGRRYRRQDEIGTPFCITIDGETATDKCVTVRNRDTLKQDRVAIEEIVAVIKERVEI